MESRVKLTARDKMEKAFFDLLQQKHYSKIAVSDIIEKAGVSRTTFYRHYVDIFDMYDKVADHLIEEFVKVLFTSSLGEDDIVLVLYDKFCELLNKQQKYIYLLCAEHGDRNFFEKCLAIVYENLDFLPFKLSQEEIFKLKFIMYASIGSYVETILDNIEFKPEILTISREILNMTDFFKEYTNGK